MIDNYKEVLIKFADNKNKEENGYLCSNVFIQYGLYKIALPYTLLSDMIWIFTLIISYK